MLGYVLRIGNEIRRNRVHGVHVNFSMLPTGSKFDFDMLRHLSDVVVSEHTIYVGLTQTTLPTNTYFNPLFLGMETDTLYTNTSTEITVEV